MSSLDKLNKLNDICLYVKDFDKALAFYKDKFGFKVKRLQPDEATANYAEFEFRGTGVTLWAKSGVAEVFDSCHIDGEGHHFMLAVKVEHVDIVDEISNQLIANGVECIKEPTTFPFGSRAAYFKDIEGNIWEVFAWLEGNGPGLL